MDNEEKWEKRLHSKKFWIFSISSIIGLIVVIPLLCAALGLITLPFLRFEKKVQLNQGVISQTYDTQYCLSNYHWFLETYQAIQQADTQIANFQQQITDFKNTYGNDPSTWGFTAQQSYNETTSELTGVQNQKADWIGQYNARTQELDRVACKNLPLYIQP